jgi:hemoglobin
MVATKVGKSTGKFMPPGPPSPLITWLGEIRARPAVGGATLWREEKPVLDPDKPSLYQRFGGYDRLAAFIEDLMPRLTGDPTLRVYWKGKCRDSMRKDNQLVLEFLCMAFGGPATYLGRDMKTSHEGLGITDEEWDIFIHHTVAALDKLQIPAQEKAEFLAAAESLKPDIVEVPNNRKRWSVALL